MLPKGCIVNQLMLQRPGDRLWGTWHTQMSGIVRLASSIYGYNKCWQNESISLFSMMSCLSHCKMSTLCPRTECFWHFNVSPGYSTACLEKLYQVIAAIFNWKLKYLHVTQPKLSKSGLYLSNIYVCTTFIHISHIVYTQQSKQFKALVFSYDLAAKTLTDLHAES